jgi:GNAT superfamily N-acetyltransferase
MPSSPAGATARYTQYSWSVGEERARPLFPPDFEFAFAEPEDANRIALLLSLADGPPTRPVEPGPDAERQLTERQLAADIRAALLGDAVEFIVARRGDALVAAIAVAADGERVRLPVGIRVARPHRHRNLERCLLHLALRWAQARGACVLCARADALGASQVDFAALGGRREGGVRSAAAVHESTRLRAVG